VPAPRKVRPRPNAHARPQKRSSRRVTHRGPDAARASAAFGRLVGIMRVLRSPQGCPWDLKQNHQTLRPFLLEEAYEVLDAIERRDYDNLAGELGDLLLQCVFHAQLAAESATFDIVTVLTQLSDKLIRRHPHVFTADGRPLTSRQRRARGVNSPDKVIEQWAEVKAGEQKSSGAPARILSGLPRTLPALARAAKIGSRVSSVGFDWPGLTGVLDKIDEEVRELRAAASDSPEALADEMGDVLFSMANLARKLHVDPELALLHANDKFTRRFDAVEARLEGLGKTVHHSTLEEMDALWQVVKVEISSRPPASAPPSSPARTAKRRRSPR
jgi:nucleoside triphosphate diphosphatase